MRTVGFLFIFIGAAIGLLLPWYQLNFLGKEISEIPFEQFNRTGAGEGTVLLKTDDNPVRVRFFAKYKVGGLLPPVEIPVQVKLSDKDGTLLGAIISFPTQGRDTGPEQGKVRSGTSLDLTIQNDGLHKLELSFAKNSNDNGITRPDVERITASFIGNAGVINETYRLPAIILAVLGFYLVVRSRRVDKNGPKKMRWGRRGA